MLKQRVSCLFEDKDIKIAGEKPSESIKRNAQSKTDSMMKQAVDASAGKRLGNCIAKEYIKAGKTAFFDQKTDDDYMVMQRLLLLSFTVTVGLERFCENESMAGIAQKSFLDSLKANAPELYSYTSDTGVFSFYFLAYRRGTDVVRRIGQTFAMLCSHDGDPIYQELGETIYCWFSSIIEQKVKEFIA